jgi:hypothetical protein
MQNKNEEDKLDEDVLFAFLDKITAFIFAYAFLHPGVNALRTPAYPEMIGIVNGEPVSFKDYKFKENELTLDDSKSRTTLLIRFPSCRIPPLRERAH